MIEGGYLVAGPQSLGPQTFAQRFRHAWVLQVCAQVSVVGPMPIEVMVLDASAEVNRVFWSPRTPSTVKHPMIKNDHVAGLCGDPPRTSKGQPLPHQHTAHGREPWCLALPTDQTRLTTVRTGNEPEFESRFGMGLEVQGNASTAVGRGRFVPIRAGVEGAVDVVAVPAGRGIPCVQIVVMQVDRVRPEHPTSEPNQPFVEQQVLDLADDLVDMARAMISVMEAIVLPMRAHTTSEVYQTLGVLARTMMRAYTKQPVLVELFRKI